MMHEAVATSYAARLKDLTSAFAPPYAAMPAVQQRDGNSGFGHKMRSGQKK